MGDQFFMNRTATDSRNNRSSKGRPIATALRETIRAGYTFSQLRGDVLAGLVTGVVAVPLSMALAIAVGVPPQYGLYTAIVAGALTALLGGTRTNVSGPTAAFVVILVPVVATHGLAGLCIASMLAGLILVMLGLAGLGRLIEFVPYPVTTGFTSGIAVVIATLQIKDFLGLEVATMPEHYVGRFWVLVQSLPTVRWSDFGVGLATVMLLIVWPRYSRRVPAPLIALTIVATASFLINHFAPEFKPGTINDGRFVFSAPSGEQVAGIPQSPPVPILPTQLPGPSGRPLEVNLNLIRELLIPALAIALLGSIESLLCAVVATGMTGHRHDPDAELIAQGAGNIVAPFFGGFAATAAIARTATGMVNNGRRSFSYLTIARLACIPFSLAGLLVCYLFGRDLFGRAAGFLSASLWCFSPNMLANGCLMTPDTGAAALGIAATYSFWKWLRAPCWLLAFAVGATWGLCLSSKFTWVILIPLFPSMWLFWKVFCRSRLLSIGSVVEVGHLILAFSIALLIVNATYAFQNTLWNLRDIKFVSESGREIMLPMKDSWLGELIVPVPQRFCEGLDLQKLANEGGGANNYLLGSYSEDGWWYYYAFGLLIKVPLALWGLVVLSACMCLMRYVRKRRQHAFDLMSPALDGTPRKPTGTRWQDIAILLAPGFVVLFLVSSQVEINRHLRYALPVLPCLFIVAGSAVAPLASWGKSLERWRCFLAALMLAAFIASSLRCFPNCHSYFNESIGGLRNGHYFMLNSNCDWGQPGYEVEAFVQSHEAFQEDIYLVYFGPKSTLKVMGLSHLADLQRAKLSNGELAPGWYVVSAEYLHGRHYGESAFDASGFLGKQPYAVIGYSIFVYHVN